MRLLWTRKVRRSIGRKIKLLSLLLAFSAMSFAVGKEPDPATTRVALYRAATDAVLLSHKWHIVSDQPDTLIAEQLCNPVKGLAGPGIYPIDFFRLTIKFAAQSAAHTKCNAVIVGYAHSTDPRRVSNRLVGPLPFVTPENKKEIQDMMAEAENRLTAKHPEYAVH